MEFKDVKLYFDINSSHHQRFYTISPCPSDKIDLSDFLDNLDEEEEINTVYGILNGQRHQVYRILLTFYNVRDYQNYMVITDGSRTTEGSLAIYGMIYNQELPDAFLGFVYQDVENFDIYQLMDSLFLNQH